MREFKLSNPLLSKAQYEEMYAESFINKEQFWSKVAKSQLTWSKDFTKVKNTNYDGDVSIKWFEDGELNVCYNCVDRHCLLYTSPSPRDVRSSRMPSSA